MCHPFTNSKLDLDLHDGKMIPDALRIETFCEKVFPVVHDLETASLLEAECFRRSCVSGTLHQHIPIWQYGSFFNGQNPVTLFETDKLEVHLKEFYHAYMDLIHYVCAVVQGLQGPRPKDLVQLAFTQNDLVDSMIAKTAYGLWHTNYLDNIRLSKTVLNEKQETLEEFIKCFKCKSNNVDTEQKQTRSADEPMTLFCMCRKCGNRFVMH